MRRVLLVAGAAAAMAAGLVFAKPGNAGAAQPGPVQAQAYSVMVNVVTGLCADDPGNSTRNGTVMQVRVCSGSAEQDIKAVPNPKGGYWLKLTNGKCLTDPAGQVNVLLQVSGCLASYDQAWVPVITSKAGTSVYWINRHTDVIGIVPGAERPGTRMQVQAPVLLTQAWCGPKVC